MANSRIMSYRIMNINEVNDAFVRGDLLNKLIFYIIERATRGLHFDANNIFRECSLSKLFHFKN